MSFFDLSATTTTLTPTGEVYICLGQPQTFICSVPKLVPLAHLEWRVNFEDSLSVASVTRQYRGTDHEGYILRDERKGLRFLFNLTSNKPSDSSLVSVMIVTAYDTNGTAVINNAFVHCGEMNSNALLHVPRGENVEINVCIIICSEIIIN